MEKSITTVSNVLGVQSMKPCFLQSLLVFFVFAGIFSQPLYGQQTLGEALDSPNLEWRTGGDEDWFAQTNVATFGDDAAESGDINDNESTWIEFTVEGPGGLVFWWKVSSEGGFDVLSFQINGETQEMISGEVDWQRQDIAIEQGNACFTLGI